MSPRPDYAAHLRTQDVGTFSVCGIVLPNGRDCPNDVDPDAPINLCASHLEQAFDWYRLNVYSPPKADPILCDVCGELEGVPADVGYRCAHCGHSSPDLAGARPETRDRPILARQLPDAKLELVYYIGFGDRIKIGTTTNLRTRLDALPHDEVLAIEIGGYQLEHHRHAEFREHRVKGEWFTRSPELLAHIATLQHPEGWAKQLRELEGKNW